MCGIILNFRAHVHSNQGTFSTLRLIGVFLTIFKYSYGKLTSKHPHTAAEGSPRPASAGEAGDCVLPQQPVSSIAAHLTAGAQRAQVGAASRGAAGHLPIGQTRSMTPVWVCV